MPEIRHKATVLILLSLLMLLLIPLAFQHGTQPMAYLPVDAQQTQSAPPYLLRTQGDALELVSADGTSQMILSIDPRTLPPHDQRTLAEGISVQSEAELEELLQDFGS